MSKRIHLLPFLFAPLFWASFHPLDLGFLGWVALVPLLVYARAASGAKSFFVAWAAGALAFGACFGWVRHTVPPGPVLLGIYNGFFTACFVLLVRRLGVLWAPAAWVALEYLRGALFGGLPWFLLGYTQHGALLLVQSADLGGVWLVSGLVALASAALVDGRRAARWGAAAVLVAALAYGAVRAGTVGEREGPAVAVVQPNIPQDVKMLMMEGRGDQKRKNFEKHVELTMRAAESKPDLVAWPEAVIYEGLYWNAAEKEWVRTPWYSRLLEPSRRAGTPLLAGVLVGDADPGGRLSYTNSVLFLDPRGEVRARYDKVHLVPFAEFVPLAGTFPWIRDLLHRFSGLRLTDMRAGEGFPVWEAGGERFGVQICFEGIFPEISRAIARNGAAFTVNISNDGWFKDSAELDQMLVMARFRAVENRMGFVRATNTGISAFIGPSGRVHAMIEGKEVEGTLTARVRVSESRSLWRAWGNWVGWMAMGAVAGGLATRFFVDRKKRLA
jgi:apolipoprotein N-acyltransferase